MKMFKLTSTDQLEFLNEKELSSIKGGISNIEMPIVEEPVDSDSDKKDVDSESDDSLKHD